MSHYWHCQQHGVYQATTTSLDCPNCNERGIQVVSLKSDFEESLAAPNVSQKSLHSFYEACVSTAVGFIFSWLILSFIVSPLFHLRTSAGEDFLINCIFTIASVLRSFGIRRFFNYLHCRNNGGHHG